MQFTQGRLIGGDDDYEDERMNLLEQIRQNRRQNYLSTHVNNGRSGSTLGNSTSRRRPQTVRAPQKQYRFTLNIDQKHINNFDSKKEDNEDEEKEELKREETQVPLEQDDLEEAKTPIIPPTT